MTESELRDHLIELFEERIEELVFLQIATENEVEADVRTFEDKQILSHNKGLVITYPNGDEFQVTIVQSKIGENQ